MDKLESLGQLLADALGQKLVSWSIHLGEITIVVRDENWIEVAKFLSEDERFCLRTCIDLCGLDYSAYGSGAWHMPRFAVAYHLLSVKYNFRIRAKVFCADDYFPCLPSVADIWPSVDWYEREAFDLFGIMFSGHPDLRRLLTDYGFVGHPFRKDFPLSGYVEMRYDPCQRRVVYQPVTVEPREVTPRVVRESGYGR
ncbi:NADH-quinone oxidoreductase subunit C [Parachitinimonas caeni]|uniref:NADH-quinone oxidoreductase subunit C n=1 Tax=Parachitinimonas caeni TaxID=3031301 RepID=A0ABT7DXK2_9NEIS|nr:NADH-quinone oxidoreductase subunit C [Parachitinimonas caeni]MDK2124801.1 NADH-quinone oxidoreductase subunit C [Parachitinimonas caeni]